METVAPLQDIPDGESYLFRFGPHQIVLFRRGTSVTALNNECPHAGASLASGYTNGIIVACPWHGWEFDCATGKCLSVDDVDAEVFPVVIEAGIVKIELPQ